MATLTGNRTAVEPDDHATPTPCAAGAGNIDRPGRRGPFGGTNMVALMDDPDDRPARPRRGRGRASSVGPSLPRANVRDGRRLGRLRGRIAKLFDNK